MKYLIPLLVSLAIACLVMAGSLLLFPPQAFDYLKGSAQMRELTPANESGQQSAPPVTATPEPGPTPAPSIIFTGDIMMARNVEAYIVKHGIDYPFAKVGDILSGADLVVGNFEGTVREKQNVEVTNVMNFDTTPSNIQMLVDAGFDLLSLSNNHSDDFGPTVTEFTRKTITDYGITPFGDGADSEKFIEHKTIGDTTFAFIGFHAFSEMPYEIIEAIQLEDKAGNFVIVYPHWGPEYITEPSTAQVEAAHMFVDAGADVVIGAHPHIIQTVETYKGVPIIYSLGNFLFDQSWSEPTKKGLVVKMTVEDDELVFDFTPIYIEERQMFEAPEDMRNQILEELGYPEGKMVVERNAISR